MVSRATDAATKESETRVQKSFSREYGLLKIDDLARFKGKEHVASWIFLTQGFLTRSMDG
jgi:hypothetical protein